MKLTIKQLRRVVESVVNENNDHVMHDQIVQDKIARLAQQVVNNMHKNGPGVHPGGRVGFEEELMNFEDFLLEHINNAVEEAIQMFHDGNL